MANQPIITTAITITSRDINGNNKVKQFNAVLGMSFDYNKGMLNIIDVTGSFYFPLIPMLAITYTIVPGVNNTHTVLMS